jgi:hypothetical protein
MSQSSSGTFAALLAQGYPLGLDLGDERLLRALGFVSYDSARKAAARGRFPLPLWRCGARMRIVKLTDLADWLDGSLPDQAASSLALEPAAQPDRPRRGRPRSSAGFGKGS